MSAKQHIEEIVNILDHADKRSQLIRQAFWDRKAGVTRYALPIFVSYLIRDLPGCFVSDLVPILQARGYWFARNRVYTAIELLVKHGLVREEVEHNTLFPLSRTRHYLVQ